LPHHDNGPRPTGRWGLPVSVTGSVSDLPALLGGPPVASFAEFPRDRVDLSESVVDAGLRALRSGAWSMFTSPEVAAFEEEFAAFIGAKHVVLVNSCTTAILASLMALDVRAGDHVAVPAYTYIGSCMPILALGARPVLVDIDPSTQSMDVSSLRIALKSYPIRAVIHVHLFGLCARVQEVSDLCTRHGAVYLSDSAQFLGDQTATSWLADRGAVCFSFGESKLLRLGEGGAIATNSSEFAERVRLARHEGELWTRLGSSRLVGAQPTTADILSHLASVSQGLNFRPLSTTAALGRVMLKELPRHLRASERNAMRLSGLLAGHTELALPHGSRTWWTYPIRIVGMPIERDLFMAALLAERVPVGVHFPRLLIEHPVVKQVGAVEATEPIGAREFATSHVVLPIYPRLSTDHMRLLSAAVSKVLRHADRLQTDVGRRQAAWLLKTLPIEELCDGLFVFLSDEQDCWLRLRETPNSPE
jgi:perosamine synthetase